MNPALLVEPAKEEAGPPAVGFDVCRGNVGLGVETVGEDAGLGEAAEVLGGWVVGVEDGGLLDVLASGGVEHREEAPLGGDVGFDGLVEVEVVGIEVGEDGDVEVAFVHAVEGEAVGGRLDDCVAAAGLDHLREHLLDFRRFGSGEAAGVGQEFVADAAFSGADETGLLAGWQRGRGAGGGRGWSCRRCR